MPTPSNTFAKAVFVASALLSGVAFASETSVSVPVTDLKFFDMGIGPIKAAPGFGDVSKGAHGTFVKFPPGYMTPLHIHTDDYYGVVVSGVVANEPSVSAKARLMPPGSYWFQKGKAAHVTKCLSANECVMFLSQPGKMDFVESH